MNLPQLLCYPVALLLIWVASAYSDTGATHFEVVRQGASWLLLRNGQPFYVRGAVGGRSLDLLRQCGANSVRIRAREASLDEAHEHGLTAMVGLPVQGQRHGLDWDNARQVAQQKESVLRIVSELKDHPAVMFWAIGNELDHIPSGPRYNPHIWERLNDLARAIKQIDPHHPVLTVVGSGRFETKIQEINQQCPDLDLIGINTYGDIAKVTRLTRQYWNKPYVVAEWGPTGHWQVPRTQWKVPIEQASSQKAASIWDRYTNVIQADRENCLGSFVFYWSEKQETTHTWYGLFRDGMKTESIDVMKYLWSGSWPANRAPCVIGLDIANCPEPAKAYLEPDTTYQARLYCHDYEYDSLEITWDVRPEVKIPKNSYAGGLEKRVEPIPGLIVAEQGASVSFRTPAERGPYRLFVQVTDSQGNAGYANFPFYVGRSP
jgi:hypothetical protein